MTDKILTKEEMVDNFYMKFREKFPEYQLPFYDIDRDRMFNELLDFADQYANQFRTEQDDTKEMLAEIISWEKDLSEYESLESILRSKYLIVKKSQSNKQ